MGRILAIAVIAAALFAGTVLYALDLPARPLGYAGIEFARMTPSAAARTPLLAKGAYIEGVDSDSPAAKAGIKPGDVVAAIDGNPVLSARQASDSIKRYRAGQVAVLTVYNMAKDGLHPDRISIMFTTEPDPQKTKRYSVSPPRTLAREFFFLPPAIANASWARRIALGPTTRPLELAGLGAGRCNGFAPELWVVAGHAPDDSMIHVMATNSFAHAVYQTLPLAGLAPQLIVQRTLQTTFGVPAVLTPAQPRPFGFTLLDFGNDKGGAGFVEYRVVGERIQMWIAAVPSADAAWALPLAGATVFSLNCSDAAHPRQKAMVATAVSLRCSNNNQCQDSDFAATYMQTLKLGYVHDMSGKTYLVQPKRDYWIDGAEGPGFYHQIGGENEKLEPGRTN